MLEAQESKELKQIKMFGQTTESIKEEVSYYRNPKIYLIGILSDIQECQDEEQRSLWLNKAKYIVDTMFSYNPEKDVL